MRNATRRIGIFLALTLATSSIFYALIIRDGNFMNWVLPLMLCPGVSAVITKLIVDRNLKGLGWKFGPVKWLGLAYVIPILYGALIYGLVWAVGLGGFTTQTIQEAALQVGLSHLPMWLLVLLNALYMGTIIFVAGALPGSIGEEVGWRGLLFPELYKVTSFTKATLLTGFIWGLYHLPIMLFADYHSDAPKVFSVVMFFIVVTGISFIVGWLRLKSGSVWPAIILHASHNLFFLNVFDPLMSRQPITDYLVTEFGLGLAVVSVVVSIYIWSRRDELPAPQPEESTPTIAEVPA